MRALFLFTASSGIPTARGINLMKNRSTIWAKATGLRGKEAFLGLIEKIKTNNKSFGLRSASFGIFAIFQ